MVLLEMSDVHKRYGGVRALNGASLSAAAGEVHGLLGPNGCGKSTLNKVLAGTVAPDRASITIDGVRATITGPIAAYRHGIAAVYQQLSVLPELTVAQNLVLGVESATMGFLTPATANDRVAALLERFGPALGSMVRGSTRLGLLAPSQQQIVEICKAILREPRILVLDEATASLHRSQVLLLFEVVRELCATGTSVVMVSHRLDEILQICARATIMRTGQTIATVEVAKSSAQEIVRLMVGSDISTVTKGASSVSRNPVSLEVDDLSNEYIHNVSFTAHRGEVIGLGGLQGQGQSELLLTLFGIYRARSGTVQLDGERLRLQNSRQAARHGFALVPGDRASQGMFAQRSIQENLSIVSLRRRVVAGFIISARTEKRTANEIVQRLQITIGQLSDPVSSLSGGNQQKVIIAKWLLDKPVVVLLDDPTKGVDISSKAEIYSLIRQLTDAGTTVIFNSSEDIELAEIADRVLVLYEGAVRRELAGADVTVDKLVASALLIGEGEDESTQDAEDPLREAEDPLPGAGETP